MVVGGRHREMWLGVVGRKGMREGELFLLTLRSYLRTKIIMSSEKECRLM